MTVIAVSNNAFSQNNAATYCGTSCPRLTIHVTKKTDYGVANSSLFEISNNLPGKVKVELFIKSKEGEVLAQGPSEPIEQGKSTIYHYNVDNVADYCIYYINYPSNEKLPWASQVKKKMNYGYGN